MMYHHILVTTDLTEESVAVAKKGWELAAQFESKLSVVHVIEPIPAYGYPGFPLIQPEYIDEIKKELAEFCKPFHITAQHQHVKLGPPKIEILNLVEQQKIDLIVVGSHGRHGIFQLLGSTANAIVHGANIDVLCVRMAE